MTKSLLECHKRLGCKCCVYKSVVDDLEKKSPKETTKDLDKAPEEANKDKAPEEGKKDKFENFQGVDNCEPSRDDTTILMELMMYYGKDVNLVELFDLFKTMHIKASFDTDCPSTEKFEGAIRDNFNKAIADLKYMGFVSATRQSTFLFKKNIFGKPKYYATAAVTPTV